MPKATVSSLEVEVWSSATEALDALDRLEAKLNKVGDALDRVVAGAKGIKDIGNLAASFKGISSALAAVEKSQRATAKHKNDGKVSNQDLIDRKRLLDDISKMSASKLLGYGNKNVFNTSGKQLPALNNMPTYRDLTKMLPAIYGGKQLPAVFAGQIVDPDAIETQFRQAFENLSFADLMGNNMKRPIDSMFTEVSENAKQLPAVIEVADERIRDMQKSVEFAKTKADAVDVEFKEIKDSVNSAADAVEQFAEKSRDSTLFGTKPRNRAYRGTPTSVWGDKYLRDTAAETKGKWYDAFMSVPGFDANIKTIGATRGLGLGEMSGVKAYGGTDMFKMAQAAKVKAEESVAALKEQTDALDETAKAADNAANKNEKLGDATEKAANKAKASSINFKKIGETLSKVGQFLGIGGKGHSSKLFGRRGFGGFLSLMVIRRALTSLIRALTGGIKEGSDNLAQYSAEYNNSISRMVSGLNYLKNAWAAAFAPIVNVVAPYIETFINLLASALNAIGRFMAALTGKGFAVQAKSVWTDYAASLDKAGSSAGGAGSKMDDLKKTIMSFDEIHALNDPNSSGGGGGSGSGGGGLNPSDMFETVDLTGDAIADFASQLREKFLAGDWEGIGSAIAEKMNKIVDRFRDGEWGEKLATAINDGIQLFQGWENAFDFDGVGEGLGNGLNRFFRKLNTIELGEAASTFVSKLSHAFTVFASVTHWDEIGSKIVEGVKRFLENDNMWFDLGTSINAAAGALLDLFTGAVEAEGKDKNFGEIVIDAMINLIEGALNGDGRWAKRLAHVAVDLGRMLLDPLGFLDKSYSAITGSDEGLWDSLLGQIDNLIDEVDKRSVSGTNRTLDDVHDAMNDKSLAISGDLLDFYESDVVDPLKGHNKKFKDNTIDSAKEAEKGVEYQFKPLDGNLEMKTWKPIAGHANAANTNISLYMATAAANITSKFAGLGNWFDTNVKVPVSSVFSTLGTSIGTAITSAKTNLQSGWGNVSNWFKTNVVDPISSTFSGLWSIGSTAAQKLRDGLKSVSMPTFHVSWSSTRKNIFGKIVEIPWPSISFYAKGGFPDADLFAANERGNPEMVGRIGNRTAVANNNQITEALKNAMIEGLMQYGMAMSASQDNAPYQINLVVKTQNDEVLARAVERGNARRNARLYPAGAVR